MYSSYLNLLYSLGFREIAITQAIKWVDGPSTIKKHDAGLELLGRNDRDVLDAYRRMNPAITPNKQP